MYIYVSKEKNMWMWIIVIIVIIIVIIYGCETFYLCELERNIKEDVHGLADNSLEITPEQFFALKSRTYGGRGRARIVRKYEFEGIYILCNRTKNMYYVGQGKNVFSRVNSHFSGRGNGDVYADYKYGDLFTIKMLSLEESGYLSLNELERKAIQTFDACYRGYNRTRGNKN